MSIARYTQTMTNNVSLFFHIMLACGDAWFVQQLISCLGLNTVLGLTLLSGILLVANIPLQVPHQRDVALFVAQHLSIVIFLLSSVAAPHTALLLSFRLLFLTPYIYVRLRLYTRTLDAMGWFVLVVFVVWLASDAVRAPPCSSWSVQLFDRVFGPGKQNDATCATFLSRHK